MDDLNRKLTEQRGFRLSVTTKAGDVIWQEPDGEYCIGVPDFTRSLDACFKWLIGDDWIVEIWPLEEGGYWCWVNVPDGDELEAYDGKGETRAIALCKALEQKGDK